MRMYILVLLIIILSICPNAVQNVRTKRQGKNDTCTIPVIANAKVKIISQKLNVATSSHLLLNITCDHNFILYPPNNQIVLCINGYWDQEIPQCIQCGQRTDRTHKPFIVNGTLSKFGDFPWHVGIYRQDTGTSEYIYACGGSIITEKVVLTVAHCFTDESGKLRYPNDYHIAAGKYYSSYNAPEDKYAQKRDIYKIDVHPRYKGYFGNYAWDIAVVIVDRPFEISNLVQPVCVDWKTDFENEQLVPYNFGEIAGWGSTEINLAVSAKELRVLKVPFIKAEECSNLVPRSFIRFITPDKFCAGYINGSSVCGGDSGGGLVFQNKDYRDHRFYVRGLVSVGVQIEGRCDDYKYSVYTKVSEYLSFIRESIRNQDVRKEVVTEIVTEVVLEAVSKVDIIPCLTPNGENAKCVSIYECKIFLDAFQNNPTPDEKRFMKNSQCSHSHSGKSQQENQVNVCCGSTTNYISAIKANPVTIKPLKHKNLPLLPSPGNGSCGRQTRIRQARIVGGEVSTLLDFPWLAIIEYEDVETMKFKYLCAGSLINDRYILTASHCIKNLRSKFRVRLGEYNRNTEIDCVNLKEGTGNLPNGRNCSDPPLTVQVEETIAHPLAMANSNGGQNDIALLRLAEKIHYTDFIKPICLPINGERSPPGRQVVVAGWGKTEVDSFSDVKLKVFLNVVSDEVCAKTYQEKFKVQLTNSHICAGGRQGKDACGGDTGGPFMATFVNSSDVYVEGIISFGPRFCGTEGIPGVATRVSAYSEWILDNIKD